MTYTDYTKTPEYALRVWRNTPQERIDALEDFLWWVEDYQNQLVKDDEAERIKILIKAYLHEDIEKIKRVENDMLKKWNT